MSCPTSDHRKPSYVELTSALDEGAKEIRMCLLFDMNPLHPLFHASALFGHECKEQKRQNKCQNANSTVTYLLTYVHTYVFHIVLLQMISRSEVCDNNYKIDSKKRVSS